MPGREWQSSGTGSSPKYRLLTPREGLYNGADVTESRPQRCARSKRRRNGPACCRKDDTALVRARADLLFTCFGKSERVRPSTCARIRRSQAARCVTWVVWGRKELIRHVEQVVEARGDSLGLPWRPQGVAAAILRPRLTPRCLPRRRSPRIAGASKVGGTGLEPVTPSLSSMVTRWRNLDTCGQSELESGARDLCGRPGLTRLDRKR